MDVNQILNTSTTCNCSCLDNLQVSTTAESTENANNTGIFNLYDLQAKIPDTSSGDSLINMILNLTKKDYTLNASVDEKGRINIKTEDGFTILFEGQQQSWKIITPDGKETKIWGDPHVEESDGDKWDFKKQSTFVFGNNKITIETTPTDNGETLTKAVTIYNGKDRLTLDNINIDKPNFVAWKLDASAHDEDLADGDVYNLDTTADGKFSWNLVK
ncbi:MAG: DUF1521 domain-containing protein [Deltaproteobacteria bacterium]|jgi:hypothetical protein|nr:DUF1521 domain-containing protein [Deltaproteobacteria bacterium]